MVLFLQLVSSPLLCRRLLRAQSRFSGCSLPGAAVYSVHVQEGPMRLSAFVFVLCCLVLLGFSATCSATIQTIYESATEGAPQNGGYSVSSEQFVGVRFPVTGTVLAGYVGGTFTAVGPDRFFAEIVQLPG